MKMQKLRIFGVALSMIFSLLTIAGYQGGCNSNRWKVDLDGLCRGVYKSEG